MGRFTAWPGGDPGSEWLDVDVVEMARDGIHVSRQEAGNGYLLPQMAAVNITLDQHQRPRMPANETPSVLFQRALEVPGALANRLEAEGFTSIEEVAYVPFAEALEALGLEPDALHELRTAAKMYLLSDEIRREDEDGSDPPRSDI